ncbi:MAG: hypothetical protein OEV15_05190, partial [Gallionella sp.]|nr:hypothetical protein [Gallionella sp.]
MTQLKYITLSSLLLTACAQAPIQPEAEQMFDPHGHQVESTAGLPNVELSRELLYQLLLAEIASQRGHAALAAEGSTELAAKTRDPRVAMRAAQLALQSGQMDKAVEAVRIWREVDPDSLMAIRTLSAVL